ncbi:MAG: cell division protein FtsZ, partial [Candidatus Micrarchaeota archaeon]|nr:cell division protein FtsZ [Candidatus Micrarchaeota archaeon]
MPEQTDKQMLTDITPDGKTMSKEDEELYKFLEASKPKIYVVGTGGSGCNTLNRVGELGVEGTKCIAMNTDVQHLVKIRANKKILLGKNVTKGLGAGSNPEVGEKAAQESINEIKESLADASLTFITCGLGGGTGTGSAHVISKQARE